ncbi:MAG: transglycosylase domain-containing protein [Gemmatimonadetes bacterium]|nr:transglycosylase domain-containing protein [Gemmatimonadota bacterium]
MWFEILALYDHLTESFVRRLRIARQRWLCARRRAERQQPRLAEPRPERAQTQPQWLPVEEPALAPVPPEQRRARKWLPVVTVAGLLFGILLVVELRASWFQAHQLARLAAEMTYRVGAGPSPSIRFPATGPYDQRLGYTRLPSMVERLQARGWVLTRQARMSLRMVAAAEVGIYPVYREKTLAGLRILDREGVPFFESRTPERVYATFEAIPPVVWKTLLYIENRELLDPRLPYRNPAVEWDRLGRASVEFGLNALGYHREVPGASTLATQLEKFRHSSQGRTASPSEKFRQVASASLRSYLDGPRTLDAQRRIVLDYLNSVPLAAIRGYGEVTGLSDGLWAWFGADCDELNRRLEAGLGEGSGVELREQAVAYRRVLTLLLAHRRPSYYLVDPEGRRQLRAKTERYLRLLVTGGVIPDALAQEAEGLDPGLRERARVEGRVPFVERKAANDVRLHLLDLLGVPSLYDVDRFDLQVRTSYAREVQDSVRRVLSSLRDPEQAQALGLVGPRMLGDGDPSRVIFSITLFERGPGGNAIRVQTDNFEGPLSVTYGTKLDLGSTAKLRTLVNYLEIVEELHGRYGGRSPEELRAVALDPSDRLSRWAVDYLLDHPDALLRDMLGAALARRYSASPGEAFFTGGGLHRFTNFDDTFDAQQLSVLEAFRHSVNLVFIRLMREIVHYYMFQVPGSTARILKDANDPRRAEYLARFADREARQFLARFYRKYRGQNPGEMLETLVRDRRLSPQRLGRAFRAVAPDASPDELISLMGAGAGTTILTESAVRELYRRSDPTRLSVADQGYLAGIHPLELWVVRYLRQHPEATLLDIMNASGEVRQEVYRWLFQTRSKSAQDQRIRALLEMEAFMEIHRAWKRVGYSFDALVPSYATAIGSSADRPVALAELVGVIVNGGIRRPVARVEELHFAEGTPYETVMRRDPEPGVRVLSPAVVQVVRDALIDVVEWGTARRAHGAIRLADGSPVVIGGKTGTGDSRFKIFTAGGRLIESKAVHRTSTFVFFIGDRFFGAVTAYVEGPEAANYTFTSSLPAQLLGVLGPALIPLLAAGES